MSTLAPAFTPAHEYAEIFALHDGAPLDELVDSVKRNGLRDPVVLLDGKVLDGRRRERACIKAGVTVKYRQFGSRASDGDDPLEFVIDLNFHRRHLGEAERALAAAKYATAKGGGDRTSRNGTTCSIEQVVGDNGEASKPNSTGKPDPTNAEAAARFEVSVQDVRRAKAVEKSCSPAVIEAVRDKVVSLSDAYKVRTEPKSVQNAALKDVEKEKHKTLTAAVKAHKEGEREPGDDTATEELADAEGVIVPECARSAFLAVPSLEELGRRCDTLRHAIEEAIKGPGGRLLMTSLPGIQQKLKDIKGSLMANRPSHVCPYCKGKKGKKPCECCKDEGWTAKHVYNQAPKGVSA